LSRRPREPTLCAHCGELKKCPRLILDEPVCGTCVLRFARAPLPCPGCEGQKILAFYDSLGRPACATCTGNPAVFACVTCGREDSQFGARCAPCVLSERLAALLADGTGGIHPDLQPVFDALMAGRRPQTALYWLTRSEGSGILRDMAQGHVDISHAAFDEMASNKAINYVRDLLVALEVLPRYDAELERVTPWLNDHLRALPADQAELLGRFAHWHVLRKLQHKGHSGTLTHGAVSAARATIVAALRFIVWLDDRQQCAATLTQADLDLYAVVHPERRDSVTPFIRWLVRSGLATGVEVVVRQAALPSVTLSDAGRWAGVEMLLHDDSIRLYTRVAGLFMLLFAQPLAGICRMRADQINRLPDGLVTVTFDTFAIELPTPLDRLVLHQLACRGKASYASSATYWLFPGGIPGNHLATENIRSQLVARGIQPAEARKAAMFGLAAEIPTPILADILGLGTNTAVRWAALASRNWGHYAALRRLQQRE
jgi:hypothetical protein